MEYNLPRDCIRNYFPSRKCFTFPHPVLKKDDLKNLDKISREELDPDFLVVSDQFVAYITRNCKCKTIKGIPVNGSGEFRR